MSKTYPKRCIGKLIFRRYRTTKAGKVIDARNYGIKAWPICEGCWVANEKAEVRTTSA